MQNRAAKSGAIGRCVRHNMLLSVAPQLAIFQLIAIRKDCHRVMRAHAAHLRGGAVNPLYMLNPAICLFNAVHERVFTRLLCTEMRAGQAVRSDDVAADAGAHWTCHWRIPRHLGMHCGMTGANKYFALIVKFESGV